MSELKPEELCQRLLDLQELDTRIFTLKREIEELAEVHHLDELAEALAEVRGLLETKEQDLEELKHKQLKLDGEVDILESKIKQEEQKLFSGTIMNPKELSAIQAEILSLRKKRDEMETEDLEEMEGIDELRAAVSQAAEDSEKFAASQEGALGLYRSERDEKERQVFEFELKRDTLKRDVPPEVIEDYEKLLVTKGGIAVVQVELGRSCGGCRIQFSNSMVDRLQHEEGVFRCETCRRILVK